METVGRVVGVLKKLVAGPRIRPEVLPGYEPGEILYLPPALSTLLEALLL